MDRPERLNRTEDNPAGMVPAAGKHAARPSEVEVRESQPGHDASGAPAAGAPAGRDSGGERGASAP